MLLQDGSTFCESSTCVARALLGQPRDVALMAMEELNRVSRNTHFRVGERGKGKGADVGWGNHFGW